MRVAAVNDLDTLWTPRPVDPSRMVRHDWLASPVLVSGPVPETADVWWGEPTEIAAEVNHRRFVLAARERAGCAVPDAGIVGSVDDLRRRAAERGPWVAKAPFSAAGRLRVRGERGVIAEPARRQAENLLELYGCLLFEPWLPRQRDLGLCVEGRDRESAAHAPHSLHVDAAGRFLGLTVGGPAEDPTSERMRAFAFGTALALTEAGYDGPFGIDAFLVGCSGVEPAVHLCEVNARLTFGHVARALASRSARATGFGEAEPPVTLRFGRGSPPDGTIPLLLPGADDDTSAWLEAPRVAR
jgi:hypothetical protein